MANSALICMVTVVFGLIVNSMAAFALSRLVTQSESIRPAIVGMDYFKQMTRATGTARGQIMAYASMITVPVLALFIAFQRAFTNSIASSGVKG